MDDAFFMDGIHPLAALEHPFHGLGLVIRAAGRDHFFQGRAVNEFHDEVNPARPVFAKESVAAEGLEFNLEPGQEFPVSIGVF